jgi:type I restriction enzyme M protein
MHALSERDPEADICTDKKGKPEADTGLRDYENVPLGESVYEYFEREVKPHVPNAWIDESKRDDKDGKVGIVGFEIPFNRHFYEFVPPRPLDEIDADLKQCTDRIKKMIEELSA